MSSSRNFLLRCAPDYRGRGDTPLPPLGRFAHSQSLRPQMFWLITPLFGGQDPKMLGLLYRQNKPTKRSIMGGGGVPPPPPIMLFGVLPAHEEIGRHVGVS